MAKVLRAPHPTLPTPCWLWQGWKNEDGYGIVRVNYRYVRAHRLFYEHFVGAIPEGLHLLHACDTPECVSPEHLRPGTQLENMADAVERGRTVASKDGLCAKGHKLTVTGDRRRCLVCKNDNARQRHASRMANDPVYRESKRANAERSRSARPPSTEDECRDP